VEVLGDVGQLHVARALEAHVRGHAVRELADVLRVLDRVPAHKRRLTLRLDDPDEAILPSAIR